jgi:LysR family transcriptional regulator (chromosome initiation inhibitor)
MDFDYDSLIVLAAVVRTGSFEAAAKSLDVTQSAVSQRIKQLEEKVGSVLVQRGRPCHATDDGLLLCQHAEQVGLLRHELGEQLAASGNHGAAVAASLRIAVNSDSLATWFPEVVERAADELNIRLEVVPDDQEFTEERLRSGDALAIVTASDNSIPGCKLFPLGDMEYMAVASTDYAARHFPNGATLAAASKSPSIRFDQKDTLPQQWMVLAFGDSARQSAHYIPSYEGHLLCCRRGIGWAMMPSVTVQPLVDSGELVEVVPGIRIQTPLFWQSRSQSSSILNRLSEVVLEVAGLWLTNDQSSQQISA